jgi:hypothetical protein
MTERWMLPEDPEAKARVRDESLGTTKGRALTRELAARCQGIEPGVSDDGQAEV